MNFVLDSSEKITYNNNTYYLRLRSRCVDNPVVLFLHGGAGSPDRAHIMKYQTALADDFTLVAWAQRGAGYAYNSEEAKSTVLTKELYVEDAHNVIEYLKNRFNKSKIIVVGHSFGSVLGVWVAQKYPQDIEAYVGVGQCIDYIKNEQLSYEFTLQEARRINDKKGIKKLEEIGFLVDGKYSPSIEEHNKSLFTQRAFLHKYGGAKFSSRKPYWQELLFDELPIIKKEYSVKALIKYLKGIGYCVNSPLGAENPDFMVKAKELQVPVYLLLGRHDLNCVSVLAEEWLMQLKAPIKDLIWFENSAHSPQWEESDKWNEAFKRIFSYGGWVNEAKYKGFN